MDPDAPLMFGKIHSAHTIRAIGNWGFKYPALPYKTEAKTWSWAYSTSILLIVYL